MLQKEMQASDDVFGKDNNLDEWANKVVSMSLTISIAGLVMMGMIIHFFLV